MSITYNEAVAAMHDHFLTVWAGPVTLSGFENEVIELDSLGADDSWTRFVVRENEWQQQTMGPVGGRNFLRKGLAILQIFSPAGKGRKAANDLADTFKDGFEGVTVAGIRYHEVTRNVIGQDGRWFHLDASAVFDYTERR